MQNTIDLKGDNKMNLTPLGSNKTELETKRARILFSYKTPVAAWIAGKHYKTSKYWSRTTSKHINNWFEGYSETAELKPQEFFDNLVK